MPPTVLRNSRPVRCGPGFGRVLAEHAGRDGGMGKAQMAPSGRCLRLRGSNEVPALVQAAPVRGQAAVRMIVPRPRAGRMMSARRKGTAPGRSAAAALGARRRGGGAARPGCPPVRLGRARAEKTARKRKWLAACCAALAGSAVTVPTVCSAT